ncbi:DUF2778 domain-containing protein [Rhizobium sp. TRM95796]|uniref:DUF2778 domain-containing protein n=1 Tax=Rhizobium sp. TRM95796 TaxID=2979862 RepID=UPI0021E730BD|nr:tlde1 domain-containing protein [Rhizobium sp. TRM95796]MCV3766414.1 DUF2778 domain-containing protein [Rhizobium sp. TRM95796]
MVLGGLVAGSVWGVASMVGAMHDARRTLAEGPNTFLPSPRPVQVAAAEASAGERRVKIAKFSSLSAFAGLPLDQTQMASAADRLAYQRQIDTQLALAEQKKKAEQARIAAAAEKAKAIALAAATTETPSMAAAMLEDTPKPDMKPFNLVLAQPETSDETALPREVPLPEAKPLIETASIERKPAEDKPAAPRTRDDRQDSAREKPKRSLFSDLFGGGAAERGWPGKNTKVAIYDVSNATVYMPDGTKLRAHSGIGRMRDNPRFEHVKMNGPTPAGIYRLSMREQRFYGVEAIRMTSIDGRHPKNRTGLLTHTNLLRGQIGSHGCVAFRNYEPFLRAFKRGQINMMVVVPELPSSRNQLAALYRKAGA